MNERHDDGLLAGRAGIALAFITLCAWMGLGALARGASPLEQMVLGVSGPLVAVLVGVHVYSTGRNGGAA